VAESPPYLPDMAAALLALPRFHLPAGSFLELPQSCAAQHTLLHSACVRTLLRRRCLCCHPSCSFCCLSRCRLLLLLSHPLLLPPWLLDGTCKHTHSSTPSAISTSHA
jgi:hypothetical protein